MIYSGAARRDMLIKVAKMYYFENLSQQKIANKINAIDNGSYNYWDNHTGSDSGLDGFIDEPYVGGGFAQDLFPRQLFC